MFVGSTLLRVDNPNASRCKIHFETTPLYTGARVSHEGAGSNSLRIGGGCIEPLGFDSDEPNEPQDDPQIVNERLGALKHLWTLWDVAGTSGAAPAEVLAKLNPDRVGFSEFRHWSVPDADKTRARFSREMYAPLVENLVKKKADGKTALHKSRYTVRDAPHYGIEGGWEVDVLWVYNERVADWEKRLPATIRKKIGTGSLGNFPHYRTFFQNPPKIIDLSATQVNLLANLHCWNITAADNAPMFVDFLS